METSFFLKKETIYSYSFFLYALIIGLGLALIGNLRFGIFLTLLPLLIFLSVKYKFFSVFLFIALLPFSYISWFGANIMGIPGAKPFNLIGAMAVIAFFVHGARLFPNRNNNVEKKAFFYLIIYFLIFSIAIFRSLEYLSVLHQLKPNLFYSSSVRYLFSSYIKPSLQFIPFIFLIKHIRENNDIDKAVDVICYSCFIFSSIILLITFSNTSLIMENRNQVRELFYSYLGMHYNAIGSLYIACYPILLCHALYRRDLFSFVNLALAIASIILIQSRSSIGATLFATYLFLILCKKKSYILWFTLFLGCFVLFWLPSFLLKTLSIGINECTLDAITLGRIDYLWIPLIKEWTCDVKLFLFGKGAFGLMTSPIYIRGFTVQATHAHNAFVNFFLNCGIIIFGLVLFFLGKYLTLAWKTGRQINSPLFWAFFSCFISYFLGAMTQRTILPSSENMLLFPIAALLIKHAEIHRYNFKTRE